MVAAAVALVYRVIAAFAYRRPAAASACHGRGSRRRRLLAGLRRVAVRLASALPRAARFSCRRTTTSRAAARSSTAGWSTDRHNPLDVGILASLRQSAMARTFEAKRRVGTRIHSTIYERPARGRRRASPSRRWATTRRDCGSSSSRGMPAVIGGPTRALQRVGRATDRQVSIAGGVGVAPFLQLAPGPRPSPDCRPRRLLLQRRTARRRSPTEIARHRRPPSVAARPSRSTPPWQGRLLPPNRARRRRRRPQQRRSSPRPAGHRSAASRPTLRATGVPNRRIAPRALPLALTIGGPRVRCRHVRRDAAPPGPALGRSARWPILDQTLPARRRGVARARGRGRHGAGDPAPGRARGSADRDRGRVRAGDGGHARSPASARSEPGWELLRAARPTAVNLAYAVDRVRAAALAAGPVTMARRGARGGRAHPRRGGRGLGGDRRPRRRPARGSAADRHPLQHRRARRRRPGHRAGGDPGAARSAAPSRSSPARRGRCCRARA